MSPSAQASEAPDLREYLAPVWRFKWFILALAFAVAAATYVYYSHKPRTYRSSTDIYVGTSGVEGLITGSEQTSSDREVGNQARVIRSRAVAMRAARKIGYRGDPDALLGAVNVLANRDADFITLVASWWDPRGAARLANAFAEAFVDQRLATRRSDADRALEAARGAMADLQRSGRQSDERRELAARISQLEILRSLPKGEALQLNRARPAAAPSTPQPRRNAIFAFVLSIALGVVAAYGMERLDRRIREVGDVTPIYDAPVLATIPRSGERLSPRIPPAVPASLLEPFRTLRTSLELEGAESGTLLVTSGASGEGKSTIVRNLALAYRDAGKDVAIVEADLRRPSAAGWLSTPPGPGLTEVLLGTAALDDALHAVPDQATASPLSGLPSNGSGPSRHAKGDGEFNFGVSRFAAGLFLLPGGSAAPDPPRLLGSKELQLLLDELAGRFDVVLVDSPPLLQVSDAMPLLAKVDGVLLVSRVGKTTDESAEHVAELVGRARGARLLGVIANDVPLASRGRYAYLKSVSTG